jgi:hypothetical protein
VKITVLDLNFYKSSDFTLYAITQQLPEFFQLGNIQGCPKLDSTASSLVFKKTKAFTSKLTTQEETILGL